MRLELSSRLSNRFTSLNFGSAMSASPGTGTVRTNPVGIEVGETLSSICHLPSSDKVSRSAAQVALAIRIPATSAAPAAIARFMAAASPLSESSRCRRSARAW